MKRPMCFGILAFVLGEIAAYYNIPIGLLVGIDLGLVCVCYVYHKRKERHHYEWVLLFLLFGFLMFLRQQSVYEEASVIQEQSCSMSGTVVRIEQKKQSTYCFLQGGEKVLAVLQGSELVCVGDDIWISGKQQEFSKSRNEGNFDERQYYYSLGYSRKILVEKIRIEHRSFYISGLQKIYGALKDSLNRICPYGEKAVLQGILLGDKQEISIETKELYSQVGISHILAISGLHISVLGMFCYQLLRKRYAMLLSGGISIFCMFSFGIMIGASAATVRALVMFAFQILAKIAGRTYDSCSALAVAGLLLLLDNPFYIFHSGFLLSFLAVVSTQIAAWISGWLDFTGKAAKSLCTSLCLFFVTLPVVAYFYYQIPVVGIFINFLVVPLLSPLVISGMAAVVLGIFKMQIAHILIWIPVGILRGYEYLATRAVKIPGSLLLIGKPDIGRIFLYTLVFAGSLGLLYRLRKQKKWKIFSALGIWILPILWTILSFQSGREMEIHLLDVGQGDCIFIRTPQQDTYLIDGGSTTVKDVGTYRILPFLKAKGVSCLDAVFISHMDADHMNGIATLFSEKEVTINTLVLTPNEKGEAYQEILQLAKSAGTKVIYMERGTCWKTEELTFYCLHPDKGFVSEDQNQNSMVLSLHYREFSMLFTGDLEKEGEQYLLEHSEWQDYDVLKVGHHGSKNATSMRLLETITPEYALISSGEGNTYGHPAPEVLERIAKQGCQSADTQQSGELVLLTDGKRYKIFENSSQ